MTGFDMTVALFIAIVFILMGYQIYFFPQKHLLARANSPVTGFDQRIPFRPGWVWIYSALFYPFWVSPILLTSSYSQFFGLCASYCALLLAHMLVAYIYPVKTPTSWRQYDPELSVSAKFLSIVQSFDRGGNSFPSMHVAVSVLTALHIFFAVDFSATPAAYAVWIFPLLIAASTLYTKQHLIIDLPAGAALAIVVYVWANFAQQASILALI